MSEWSSSRGYHYVSALTLATTGVSYIRKLSRNRFLYPTKSLVAFSLLSLYQSIDPGPMQFMFRNKASFYGEELWTPRPTPKLEDQTLSAVRDCLFNIPYILESNPHPFYSFRGLKNQMRIRIACGLDSRFRAGFWKNDRAAVRAVRTIQ